MNNLINWQNWRSEIKKENLIKLSQSSKPDKINEKKTWARHDLHINEAYNIDIYINFFTHTYFYNT